MATEDSGVELPPKIGVHPREDCYIHAMPCYVRSLDTALIKWAAGYPSNFEKGLPFINGVIVVNDPETGLVKCIMDSALVTAWRTGAATGACARIMSGETAETAAIIGAGVQGQATGVALKEGLDKLKELRVYDVVESQMEKFEKEVGSQCPGLKIVRAADPQRCVEGADVIATAVPTVDNPKPFVKKQWLKPDALVITEDHDAAVCPEIMHDGLFICDYRRQYLQFQQLGLSFKDYPKNEGIYADMSEICSGAKAPIHQGLRGAVLMGIAMHDIMTVRLVMDKLSSTDIGQDVEI
jgi:ornithine cyclodeaminase/alanine dehydrogenase